MALHTCGGWCGDGDCVGRIRLALQLVIQHCRSTSAPLVIVKKSVTHVYSV